jgi:hypothetical protein
MYLSQFIKEYYRKTPRTRLSTAIKTFWLWRKSLIEKKSALDYELPWINLPAIYYLKKHLKKNSKIAEFGAGGSTLFFIADSTLLVTFEHDKKWFKKINDVILKKKLTKKWRPYLIEPEFRKTKIHDFSNPESYQSSDTKKLSFKKYASKIEDYPAGFFDAVLVDGRARPSCVKHAAAKIRVGGILILDNTERDYYTSDETKKHLVKMKCTFSFFGPVIGLNEFTKTNIYKKID